MKKSRLLGAVCACIYLLYIQSATATLINGDWKTAGDNLITRKAYGFKTFHAVEIALYHALGALPAPKTTHVFF